MRRRIEPKSAIALFLLALGCQDPLPPVSCDSGADMEIPWNGSATREICFTDPNGDMLTYEVESRDAELVTATLSGTDVGPSLSRPPPVIVLQATRLEGRTDVVVTATDPGGLVATSLFRVVVIYPLDITVTTCEIGSTVTIGGKVASKFNLTGLLATGYLSDGNTLRSVGTARRAEIAKGEAWAVTVGGTPEVRDGDVCHLVVDWDN